MYQRLLKNKDVLLDQTSIFLVLGILTTLTLSISNLNSLFIILLFIITLLRNNFVASIKVAWTESFFRSCFLFFFVFVAGIFYATDFHNGINSAEKRLALLIIPFIFCSRQFEKALRWSKVMFVFSFIFLAIALYCFLIALFHFLNSGETDFFFYHPLVKPISQNAIYVSIIAFIVTLFLFEEKKFVHSKIAFGYYPIVIFMIIFLVLLSSKLVLTLLFFYTIFKSFYLKSGRIKWYVYLSIIAVGLAFIIGTNNPVKARFKDILRFDTQKFHSKDLSAAYFNGIEFRLFQWKMTYEILNDERAWVIGVSTADAQPLLDKKFKEYHLYQGDLSKGDRGYLGYNVHNQFVQCLLQSGLIGLIAFLFVCYNLLRLSIRKNITELRMIILLLISFCFTESVLQSQRGLVSFTLFPLLIYYGKALKVS